LFTLSLEGPYPCSGVSPTYFSLDLSARNGFFHIGIQEQSGKRRNNFPNPGLLQTALDNSKDGERRRAGTDSCAWGWATCGRQIPSLSLPTAG
jgi:hypothetical protein